MKSLYVLILLPVLLFSDYEVLLSRDVAPVAKIYDYVSSFLSNDFTLAAYSIGVVIAILYAVKSMLDRNLLGIALQLFGFWLLL